MVLSYVFQAITPFFCVSQHFPNQLVLLIGDVSQGSLIKILPFFGEWLASRGLHVWLWMVSWWFMLEINLFLVVFTYYLLLCSLYSLAGSVSILVDSVYSLVGSVYVVFRKKHIYIYTIYYSLLDIYPICLLKSRCIFFAFSLKFLPLLFRRWNFPFHRFHLLVFFGCDVFCVICINPGSPTGHHYLF